MFSTSISSSVPISASSVSQKQGTTHAKTASFPSSFAQRPSDAPEPDSTWTSLDKSELNKIVRELLSECKHRLVCPNCNESGNITKSSANGDIRLQCVTKGLANGTKKGQCSKSWNLSNSMAVLNYAKFFRPNQKVFFWSDKPGTQRSAATAPKMFSSPNRYNQSVKSNAFSLSYVPSPTQILQRPQSTQNFKDEGPSSSRVPDEDLLSTQVLPSRRLAQVHFNDETNVNLRGYQKPMEDRPNLEGPEERQDNALDSAAAPKNVATRGRQQTPFHPLKPTPLNRKKSQEAPQRVSTETGKQGNGDSSPLATYSYSPTSANYEAFGEPFDDMGMICKFSSSPQRDFISGSGSDAGILSGLIKRIPSRRLSSPDQRKLSL
jgi:hypothetical protein